MEGTATKKGVGMADGDVGGNGIVAVDEDGTEKGVGGSEDGDPTEALAALAGKSIEDVYGGEHLLRLFGTLRICLYLSIYTFKTQFPLSQPSHPTYTQINTLHQTQSKPTYPPPLHPPRPLPQVLSH